MSEDFQSSAARPQLRQTEVFILIHMLLCVGYLVNCLIISVQSFPFTTVSHSQKACLIYERGILSLCGTIICLLIFLQNKGGILTAIMIKGYFSAFILSQAVIRDHFGHQ